MVKIKRQKSTHILLYYYYTQGKKKCNNLQYKNNTRDYKKVHMNKTWDNNSSVNSLAFNPKSFQR